MNTFGFKYCMESSVSAVWTVLSGRYGVHSHREAGPGPGADDSGPVLSV